jgi:hypothetical protein
MQATRGKPFTASAVLLSKTVSKKGCDSREKPGAKEETAGKALAAWQDRFRVVPGTVACPFEIVLTEWCSVISSPSPTLTGDRPEITGDYRE